MARHNLHKFGLEVPMAMPIPDPELTKDLGDKGEAMFIRAKLSLK